MGRTAQTHSLAFMVFLRQLMYENEPFGLYHRIPANI